MNAVAGITLLILKKKQYLLQRQSEKTVFFVSFKLLTLALSKKQ